MTDRRLIPAFALLAVVALSFVVVFMQQTYLRGRKMSISHSSVQVRESGQNIPNATTTTLSFTAVNWDDGPYWDAGSPTQLTVLNDCRGRVNVNLKWGTSTGLYKIFVYVDGSQVDEHVMDFGTASSHPSPAYSNVFALSQNQIITIGVYQSTGAAVAVDAVVTFTVEG